MAIKTHVFCVSRTDNNLLGFPYPLPSCVNLLSIPSDLNVNFLFLDKSFLEHPTSSSLACLIAMPALQLSALLRPSTSENAVILILDSSARFRILGWKLFFLRILKSFFHVFQFPTLLLRSPKPFKSLIVYM